MTFEAWWAEHGNSYWGAPVQAAQEAWNAAQAANATLRDMGTKMARSMGHKTDCKMLPSNGGRPCSCGCGLQQAKAMADWDATTPKIQG